MNSKNRKFNQNPDKFCYIRSEITLRDRKLNITRDFKKTNNAYCNVKHVDEEENCTFQIFLDMCCMMVIEFHQ